MYARQQKPTATAPELRATARDAGFTLIELLVVMIIIGILASIAIPVFLTQRSKARDAATKSDVSRVGKEYAAYYVDGTGALTFTVSGGNAVITTTTGTAVSTLALSTGTALPTPASGAQSGTTSTTWCVALTNPNGSSAPTWTFSATGGLAAGTCP